MNKDATTVLARYVEEAVSGARGSLVSISIKRINRWYEKKFGASMPRKMVLRIVKALKILHTLGVLMKIGSKFVIERGSQLWRCAKEGRARECINVYMTEYARVVEAA